MADLWETLKSWIASGGNLANELDTKPANETVDPKLGNILKYGLHIGNKPITTYMNPTVAAGRAVGNTLANALSEIASSSQSIANTEEELKRLAALKALGGTAARPGVSEPLTEKNYSGSEDSPNFMGPTTATLYGGADKIPTGSKPASPLPAEFTPNFMGPRTSELTRSQPLPNPFGRPGTYSPVPKDPTGPVITNANLYGGGKPISDFSGSEIDRMNAERALEDQNVKTALAEAQQKQKIAEMSPEAAARLRAFGTHGQMVNDFMGQFSPQETIAATVGRDLNDFKSRMLLKLKNDPKWVTTPSDKQQVILKQIDDQAPALYEIAKNNAAMKYFNTVINPAQQKQTIDPLMAMLAGVQPNSGQ